MLARWSIPDEQIAAAAEEPYFFDPQVFIDAADEALAWRDDTPSDAVAREDLPASGVVLDAGVGAGAASLRLNPGRVVGVDPSGELLAAFAQRAARRGIEAVRVEVRWPDVASRVPAAEVAVCHHVVYNVSDLAGFAATLSSHAARRVVVELTTVHPMAWMTPYWESVHRLTQPDRPTVEDAIGVFGEQGFDVREQRWEREVQMIGENGAHVVARVARRLCVPAARHEEVRRVMALDPPPRARQVATLWWDTSR